MPNASPHLSKRNLLITGLLLWIGSIAVSWTWWDIRLDHDDQALFRLGSEVLRSGGTLYTDIWDLKQPGIYWYYQVAESLFGAGPVSAGVHILTSIWLATAAVFAAYVAGMSQPGSRAWLAAPFFTLLVYVCRVDVYTLAQVESLIALPVLASMACVAAAARRPGTGIQAVLHLVAGGLAGVVATFKLILLVIPAAVILLDVVSIWRRNRREAVHALMWSLLGFLLLLLWVAWPFIEQGSWRLFLWTQFEYPAKAVLLADVPPIAKLFTSSLYLVSSVLLLLPAALAGYWKLAKSPLPQARLVGHGSLCWIVIGLLAIAVQRFSWHAYHFTMLFWPIGVLAACGLSWPRSRLMTAPGTSRCAMALRAATVVAVLGMVVNVGRFAHRQLEPAQPEFNSSTYLDSVPELKAYRADHACRSAIVFGSPVLLHAVDLDPVGPITGQLSIILLPQQWDALLLTLAQRRPQYVYIAERQEPVLQEHGTEVLAWINANYSKVSVDGVAGTWYGYAGERVGGECQSVITELHLDKDGSSQ